MFGHGGYSALLYLFSAIALFLIMGLIVYFATKRAARKVVKAELERMRKEEGRQDTAIE